MEKDHQKLKLLDERHLQYKPKSSLNAHVAVQGRNEHYSIAYFDCVTAFKV